MLKIFLVAIVLVVTFESQASARILEACDIATELYAQGYPKSELADWVCLVKNESGGNTAAIGGPNPDGSRDYGMFHVNDRYWCAHGTAGKDCNVECNQLLTDDITESAKCARIIYARSGGFSAWNAWNVMCQNRPLPPVDHCFN